MLQKIKIFLFQNQTIRQTVAKNTFWLFFGEISGRLLRAVLVIYAARILGVENWGVFSYTITMSAFFSIFSDFGLSALLTKKFIRNPETQEKYLSTAFFIKLGMLIFSIFLIIFIAPFFTKIEAVKPLLLIAALILAFDGLREFSLALNRALEKMEREALVKIITNFAIVGFGIGFLLIFATARTLAIAYAIGSGIGFLAIIWILRSYFKNLFSNFSKNLLWPILTSAWPFALLGLLGTIMINTDILMLGWYKTTEEIGFYSAAQRPVQFFYIIPGLFAMAVFPTFARLAKKDNEKFRRILERTITLILLIGTPLALGGIILGKEVILLLFGNQYLASVLAFQILLITILFNFPNALLSNAIFAYDEQKKFIGVVALGALGNVALNILLIPPYGIAGAAIATIGAQILITGFIWLKMKKINYFAVFPYLKKVLLATTIMAIITFGLKYLEVNLFINLIASIIIYFGSLTILKESILKEIKGIINAK
jgi:O-antigen/teichoic acid export membrane protein